MSKKKQIFKSIKSFFSFIDSLFPQLNLFFVSFFQDSKIMLLYLMSWLKKNNIYIYLYIYIERVRGGEKR
jgi:hypothetical protein